MRHLIPATLAILIGLAPPSAWAQPGLESARSGDPVIEKCAVKFVDEVELPAPEPGVLMFLGVKDGALVKKGDEIARIDDREVQVEKLIVTQEFNAAVAKYKDDIDERYSKAAALVAQADYEEKVAANSGPVDNVVPETEVRKSKLEWDRAKLAQEKATKDKELARYEALVSQAKLKAADIAIEKRVIRAPFDGEVRRVVTNESEWVSPGDPILELVRYDILKVDGYLDLAQYDPREVAGREVTITVEVGRGQQAQATGRIVLVEQQVKQSDRARYMVRAEIPNRMVDGRWLILPGLQATMQIHLDRPAANVSRRRTER
jgi:multidrug efflux pump subunit AcrA (membrane-fusion protein)